MGGIKDDLDDLDEELGLGDDSADDADSFDDEDGDDDEAGGKSKSGKKNKSDSPGFDRDSYYFYKDKLVQLSGTIRPKERSKEGKVLSLEFKTDDKVYAIIMDDMSKKLLTCCFQEFLVTGLVSKISEKEYSLAIKTYI
jgi:hypothetical protein